MVRHVQILSAAAVFALFSLQSLHRSKLWAKSGRNTTLPYYEKKTSTRLHFELPSSLRSAINAPVSPADFLDVYNMLSEKWRQKTSKLSCF